MEDGMTQKQVMWRYGREMVAAFAVYAVLLVASITFGRPLADGALRTMVLFAPMLGFLGMIWATARHLGSVDEYQRKMLYETWAIASALTAALTFSYGFLETAGYPRISMFNVWMIMGGTWFVVNMARLALKR
jgi:hypothetical protein